MKYTQSTSSPKEILGLFYKIEDDILGALDNKSSNVASAENVLSSVYCEDILQGGMDYKEMMKMHGNTHVLEHVLKELRSAREVLIETNKLKAYDDFQKSRQLYLIDAGKGGKEVEVSRSRKESMASLLLVACLVVLVAVTFYLVR